MSLNAHSSPLFLSHSNAQQHEGSLHYHENPFQNTSGNDENAPEDCGPETLEKPGVEKPGVAYLDSNSYWEDQLREVQNLGEKITKKNWDSALASLRVLEVPYIVTDEIITSVEKIGVNVASVISENATDAESEVSEMNLSILSQEEQRIYNLLPDKEAKSMFVAMKKAKDLEIAAKNLEMAAKNLEMAVLAVKNKANEIQFKLNALLSLSQAEGSVSTKMKLEILKK